MKFNPANVTVKVGDTIEWTNADSMVHTATALVPAAPDKPMFDSGRLAKDKTYSYEFKAAGTVPYHCTIHPGMKGEIKVT
jgi:plastocyanin